MGSKESGQMTGTESEYSTMSYTWIDRKQAWSGYMEIQDLPPYGGGGGGGGELRNMFRWSPHVGTSTWTQEPSDLLKDRKRSL